MTASEAITHYRTQVSAKVASMQDAESAVIDKAMQAAASRYSTEMEDTLQFMQRRHNGLQAKRDQLEARIASVEEQLDALRTVGLSGRGASGRAATRHVQDSNRRLDRLKQAVRTEWRVQRSSLGTQRSFLRKCVTATGYSPTMHAFLRHTQADLVASADVRRLRSQLGATKGRADRLRRNLKSQLAKGTVDKRSAQRSKSRATSSHMVSLARTLDLPAGHRSTLSEIKEARAELLVLERTALELEQELVEREHSMHSRRVAFSKAGGLSA